MELSAVLELVERIAGPTAGSGLDQTRTVLGDVRRVRSWLASHEARWTRHLTTLSPQPEADIAAATNTTTGDAARTTRRAGTLADVPAFDAALADGTVSGEHVDALSNALRDLKADQQASLLDDVTALVGFAGQTTAKEFARCLRRRVGELEQRDGMAELDRQRRAARLRMWTDPETGMGCFTGKLDPLSFVKFEQLIHALVRARIANGDIPDGGPLDPIEHQAWVQAQALLDLINGKTTNGTGRPEVIVVVDTRFVDQHGRPVVDWGPPVDIPNQVLIDLLNGAGDGTRGADPSGEANSPAGDANSPAGDAGGGTDADVCQSGDPHASDCRSTERHTDEGYRVDDGHRGNGPPNDDGEPGDQRDCGGTAPPPGPAPQPGHPPGPGTKGSPTSGPHPRPGPTSGAVAQPSPLSGPGGKPGPGTTSEPATQRRTTSEPATPGTQPDVTSEPATPGTQPDATSEPATQPRTTSRAGTLPDAVCRPDATWRPGATSEPATRPRTGTTNEPGTPRPSPAPTRSAAPAPDPRSAPNPRTAPTDRSRRGARVVPVIVDGGIIVHAPGPLDRGRGVRTATPAQRRALRALYPTCAIPGCDTRFDRTHIHHVIAWLRKGRSDLDNLLPLCSRHHHLVHDQGWKLHLSADRTLTITFPNGRQMSTGPPRRRAG